MKYYILSKLSLLAKLIYQFISQRLHLTLESSLSTTTKMSQKTETSDRIFHCWNDLSQELQLHVLTYVASAPFENLQRGDVDTYSDLNTSSLISSLPLVNKTFLNYVNQYNELWQLAHSRACKNNKVWQSATSRCIAKGTDARNFRSLYENTLINHISFVGPIFLCSTDLPPDLASASLDFMLFEPRYLFMLHELMQGRPVEEWFGQRDIDTPTLFLHAYKGLSLTIDNCDNLALLVHIEHCQLGRRSEAYVRLKAVAKVRVLNLWERPNSAHLCYANTLIVEEINTGILDRWCNNV